MHTNVWNFIIKNIVNKINGVIVITQGLKNFFIKKGINKNNVLVSHDVVDLKEFDIGKNKIEIRQILGLPQDKKIISYVGKYKTMGEYKGLDDIIQSFSEIYKERKDIFLLFVGINKEEIEEITKKIKSFYIQEVVYKVITHVVHTRAIRYIKASDILIMNYPNTEHYANYMSPLKMFEKAGFVNVKSVPFKILNESDTWPFSKLPIFKYILPKKLKKRMSYFGYGQIITGEKK